MTRMPQTQKNILWLAILFSVLIWSAINPKDYPTWWLEVAPALIALAVMVWTRKTFPLTFLLYVLILVHSIILMIGGHYTYAEVPLFDSLKEIFNLERNNYDKLGHLAQGFIPAIAVREILLRRSPLAPGKMLFFIVCCIVLAISAMYELIEWWVALLSEEAAEAFLGTQGYVWDTQSDMLWALTGAVVAQLLLVKFHDKQMKKLPKA
jgi:putative membrane protein